MLTKAEAVAALERSIRAQAIEAGRQLGLSETEAIGALARLGKRIDFDEWLGIAVERSETDPTLVTVHFPPQILDLRLTADVMMREWLDPAYSDRS